ncbi:uncharacterized protein VICG_00917 [Vittaforma corneae ATCC 50505]|uniref:DNA-directed RNA polymerase subunit n=1 Tax=Vittaforma corneae (strain ATCC 50505) TaxID=993615 RepID=L2GME6_VITCO|nr:uncharacterized protein VICG_00917 [Vittaforma corneae ATCC 50505]ELA42068.1 hypothetical protein VICG_00917 [Vittaforma corneae ATCC 50505]
MFCKCGALIFFPTLVSEEIRCRRCNSCFKYTNIFVISVAKELTRQDEHEDVQVRGARISLSCPKCNRPEMMYSTAQLRSADEGQTVFYSCEGCGYKETIQS